MTTIHSFAEVDVGRCCYRAAVAHFCNLFFFFVHSSFLLYILGGGVGVGGAGGVWCLNQLLSSAAPVHKTQLVPGSQGSIER